MKLIIVDAIVRYHWEEINLLTGDFCGYSDPYGTGNNVVNTRFTVQDWIKVLKYKINYIKGEIRNTETDERMENYNKIKNISSELLSAVGMSRPDDNWRVSVSEANEIIKIVENTIYILQKNQH